MAAGRDTTEAHIRDVGLVDEIGGLSRAIERAQEAAGLASANGRVREINPVSGTLGLGAFLPGPLSRFVNGKAEGTARPATRTDPVQTVIRLALEHQPRPLVLLPPRTVPKQQ